MERGWHYLRIAGEPDLEQLGAEGWELVAIRGEEWLFKRPEPGPTERFTLEQRAAALSAAPARHPESRRLLNPQIASLIRQINHTQLHSTITTSRRASGGTPRSASARRSSRLSAIASTRLVRASSLVLPWPLAPGTSGQ
jgi:hypothetical protein